MGRGAWDAGRKQNGARVVGRGTRDEMKWEGEASAEPKTAANSDWRIAISETAANGDWRIATGETKVK
jgi:hypothetical protein